MAFTWTDVLRSIRPGSRVPYFAPSRKFQNGEFEILEVTNETVEVRPRAGKPRRFSRADFEAVAHEWADHKAGRIDHAEVHARCFNLSYIYGMLHLLETKNAA